MSIRDEGETIDSFGDVRLGQKPNGKIELTGCSRDGRSAARECSLFLPESAFSCAA